MCKYNFEVRIYFVKLKIIGHLNLTFFFRACQINYFMYVNSTKLSCTDSKNIMKSELVMKDSIKKKSNV